MKFVAFYKSGDALVKAYETADQQDVVAIAGDKEFWFSSWRNQKKESVLHAIGETCKRVGVLFSEDDVVFAGAQ